MDLIFLLLFLYKKFTNLMFLKIPVPSFCVSMENEYHYVLELFKNCF